MEIERLLLRNRPGTRPGEETQGCVGFSAKEEEEVPVPRTAALITSTLESSRGRDLAFIAPSQQRAVHRV